MEVKSIKTKELFVFVVLLVLLLGCQKNETVSSPRIPIYLNHVWLMIDSSTYASVNRSVFLRKSFAHIRRDSIRAGGGESWNGTYIFGRNTYLEFFNSGQEKSDGLCGIGFAVEQPGGIDTLFQRIGKLGLTSFEKGSRARQTDAGKIPWFTFLASTSHDTGSILSIWLMEYTPEYMRYKYPDIAADKINITRRFYNHSVYRSDLLLNDIIEIELVLNRSDAHKTISELKAYGFQIGRNGEQDTAKGDGIKIIIYPEQDHKRGIYKIKFSLNDRFYKPQDVVFSPASKLVLNRDRTAEWYFNI